jgi:hypothetical protein
MNRHWDDASLLEAHYLELTGQGERASHLAACADCSARLATVVSLVREDAEFAEPPDSFFTRQRMQVERRVAAGARSHGGTRIFHVAIAAMLALVLGGLLFYRSTTRVVTPATVTQTASSQVTAQNNEDLTVPRDPWESDQLKDFSSVVEWESLVDKTPVKGDQS